MGALRHRDFRLLFAGQAISSFGDTLVPVALAFAVLDLTGSATDLGFVLGASAVAVVLFMLIGGLVADRVPRRSLMVAADALRCAAQLALGIVLVAGRLAVVTIAALSAVTGIATALFEPAAAGLTPAVVPPGDLQQANALQQTAAAGAGVAGPAAAGLLVVTAGPGWAIVADSVTFAASVALLALMRPGEVPRQDRQRWLDDLREGWQDFRGRTWFWTVVAGFSAANLLFSGYLVLGPLASRRYYDGAPAWAAIATAMAIGSVLGGLLAIRLRPRYPLRLALPVNAVIGLAPVTIALRAPVPVAAAVTALAGAGVTVFASLWQTSVQRNIPEDRLSRASSYDYLGSLLAAPAGLAIAGPAAAALGLRPVLLASGVLLALVMIGLLLVPAVRNLAGPASEAVDQVDA